MAAVKKSRLTCYKQELDVHKMRPVQDCIQDSRWLEVTPETNLANSNLIIFEINGTDKYWLDLSQHIFQVTLTITNADGTPLADKAVVAPTTAFMHTMFSKARLVLNGTRIGSENSDYGYCVLIKLALNYGMGAAEQQLRHSILKWDDMRNSDDPDPTVENGNLALANRTNAIKKSRLCVMAGRLEADFFGQPRLIPSRVNVRLELQRARPEFCLISPTVGANYRINLIDCRWKVRRVSLSAPTADYMERQLLREPAHYPYAKVEPRTFAIPKGSMAWQAANLFLGKVPQRVFLALVTQKGHNGSYDSNPFAFRNRNVSQVDFLCDDESLLPRPIQTEFAEERENYMAAYIDFLQAARILGRNVSTDVPPPRG